MSLTTNDPIGMQLDFVRCVLVHPMYAGNLGSCARICANFGVQNFYAVTPACDLQDVEALKYATGIPSRKILENIQIHGNLPEALHHTGYRIAMTARTTALNKPTIEFDQILDLNTQFGPIALVFGPEDRGLSRHDIDQCTHVCAIPTHPEKPAMNLSHAVALVIGTIYHQFSRQRQNITITKMNNVLETRSFQHLMDEIKGLIAASSIKSSRNHSDLSEKIRLLLLRSNPSASEINMFYAFLKLISRTE